MALTKCELCGGLFPNRIMRQAHYEREHPAMVRMKARSRRARRKGAPYVQTDIEEILTGVDRLYNARPPRFDMVLEELAFIATHPALEPGDRSWLGKTIEIIRALREDVKAERSGTISTADV